MFGFIVIFGKVYVIEPVELEVCLLIPITLSPSVRDINSFFACM
jgi:hypothetical protein